MQDQQEFGQAPRANDILAERAFLASIVDSSDNAIIGMALDGTMLSWNAAAEKMFGFSAEEAIGESILLVVPPDRRDEIPQSLDRIKRGEGIEHYETKRIARTGRQIDVSVTVSPIKSPSGEIVGASSMARDITQRKRTEEALKAAGEYSRSLIEASLDPLVTISAEGKITDVNTATERVTGCSRNELVGTDFADYFTDPGKARAGYQQAFRDGSVTDYELEIRHKGGGLTPVMYNASVYQNEAGEIIGLFAAARDITESKRAEKALHAASAYNRSLIELSLDPLVTISAEGKITDVNTATERVTGCSRKELVDTDFADYFTDPSRARTGYQQAFREGSVQDYELEIRHKDGHLTQVTYNASVYYDEAGKIIGLFAAARDISARKQAEMERESLISELEAKNAELERFTYSVSHDLRSPLITIRTFLGFVAEAVAKGNTSDLQPDLDRIDKAAEKMGHLLDEILELSRVGRLFNPPSEVPLGDLVNEVLELLSGRIARHGVEVQVDAALPVLYGDRPRLQEVLQNLVENAIKFMGDQPHPRIEIGAAQQGHETIVSVRDNGIGIDRLFQEKVFGLFNKLDQKSEGTGIGLALVKRIVEVHGGRVRVESEGAGQGSTFRFTLPSPIPGREK